MSLEFCEFHFYPPPSPRYWRSGNTTDRSFISLHIFVNLCGSVTDVLCMVICSYLCSYIWCQITLHLNMYKLFGVRLHTKFNICCCMYSTVWLQQFIKHRPRLCQCNYYWKYIMAFSSRCTHTMNFRCDVTWHHESTKTMVQQQSKLMNVWSSPRKG